MTTPQQRKPRGKGKSKKDQMANLLDRELLFALKHGMPAMDPATGMQAMHNGEPVYRPLTPAMIAQVQKRLDALTRNPSLGSDQSKDLIDLAKDRLRELSTSQRHQLEHGGDDE